MEASMDLKHRLHEACLATVEEKIHASRSAMEVVQKAANQESKSSVGDKYETGRAMMQLELEKMAFQLEEAIKLKKQLHQIKLQELCHQAELGSVIITSIGNFFIAVSLGKIAIEDTVYFTISLASPIGQALYQHQAGDEITFNGRQITIEQVF
ncbi:3-oxoacyl-ACP synthase [Fulvivirgaceae bacterium BMA12]|uniref:3-oxoacyl-ACP synthase n=1 Tax=Agaribacillus aureus TaxID=3051825 RepID=A0ABT8LD90_9BACT|nr:3-oxoacyl-ACP synthase [Fulvivirgaceae bacterium BMA12]